MAPIPFALCTDADMTSLFSSYGVVSFADNDNDGASDAGVVDRCINWATAEVQVAANGRFTAQQLTQSVTANRWATIIAVFYLCHQRGNPPPASLLDLVNEIRGESGALARFAAGTLYLDGVASPSTAPSYNNHVIDRRFQKPLRTERNTTNGVPPNPARGNYGGGDSW